MASIVLQFGAMRKGCIINALNDPAHLL